MPQVIIPNPVLNSPYDEPTRHFFFGEDGITDKIVESRRLSSYFVPVPQPKKKSTQLLLDTQWTQDRIEENKFINDVRNTVAKWRFGGYEGVTGVTRQLLEYWRNPERERRLFFCQIEALETAIYLAEAIGPQYGTVGPDDVKEAAKEAVHGVGYDLLVVCGFAFDPHVSEEVKRYGKLVVQAVRMNPDLLMGEELLKKTGAGNLFMVFGEPDVEIRKRKDGKLEVEIRGVDVYDPTTQEIRSHSTDDIACWFIDTAYNGESFFVRHAYFTGADDPYDKLKRALRAEVDEAAWASLYSTTSRPFERPKTRKIAVKVINHYGDEVLKVFRV
jgi:hypothetical protein